MKNLKIIFGLFAIAAACSCNSGSKVVSCDIATRACLNAPPLMETVQFSPPVAHSESIIESDDSEPIQAKIPANKKKIIKEGSISIKAGDIAVSKKNIDALLKKFNAYYDLEEYRNNDRNSSYTLNIRVPVLDFENLLFAIESGKDEITNKSINTTDVTEEYIDTESRLANKREYLKRYKEILLRAGTIKDVLEVEENIRVLQEEIESKEGRLKYLTDQVAYSTLDITLYHEKPYTFKPEEQATFSERVKSSLNNGWTSVVDFSVAFIGIWPVILMVLAAVFAARRVIKKRKANKTN